MFGYGTSGSDKTLNYSLDQQVKLYKLLFVRCLFGLQDFSTELPLCLRPHTRDTRSTRRSGQPLQASKTMSLEGKQDRSSAYIKDEDGVLLRDIELIHERWIRWFHTLLNAKSPKLDPNIAEGLDQWLENMPLRVQPILQELTDAIRSLANGNAVGPDGVSIELFKITLNGGPALRRRLLGIVVCIWTKGEVPQQWKYDIIMVVSVRVTGTAIYLQ